MPIQVWVILVVLALVGDVCICYLIHEHGYLKGRYDKHKGSIYQSEEAELVYLPQETWTIKNYDDLERENIALRKELARANIETYRLKKKCRDRSEYGST